MCNLICHKSDCNDDAKSNDSYLAVLVHKESKKCVWGQRQTRNGVTTVFTLICRESFSYLWLHHREKASTNSTRNITSRAETLTDGCSWMEMRLFLSPKLTCKCFLHCAANLHECWVQIMVRKQFTCLQISGRENTKEDVRWRQHPHPSSDSDQVSSLALWHTTFAF